MNKKQLKKAKRLQREIVLFLDAQIEAIEIQKNLLKPEFFYKKRIRKANEIENELIKLKGQILDLELSSNICLGMNDRARYFNAIQEQVRRCPEYVTFSSDYRICEYIEILKFS